MSKLTEQQTNEIAELRERGWSYGRIALRFGVSEGAVNYHCLRLGAVSPSGRRRVDVSSQPTMIRKDGRVQRRFTAEEDRQMQDLSRQGFAPAKIAERMGRAPTSVRMRLLALALDEEDA